MHTKLSAENIIVLSIFIIGIWLRITMLAVPFVEYQANRSIESAVMVREFSQAGDNPFTIKSIMPEFQLLPYIVASIYKTLVFLSGGVENLRRISAFILGGDGYYNLIAFLGRGLVIFISVCGMYFLYRIARIYLSKTGTIFAIFVYALLPVSFFYQRVFMVDAIALSLNTIGLYYFIRWIEKEKNIYLVNAGLSLAFSFLFKLNYLYIAIPILYLVLRKYKWRTFSQWKLWAWAIGVISPSIYHYFFRYNRVMEYLGSHMPSLFLLLRMLFIRHFITILTPIGFILFFIGLWVCFKNKLYLFLAWIIGVMVNYLITGYEPNRLHFYYQLPVIPVAALCMGLGVCRINKYLPKISLILITMLLVTGIILTACINDNRAINWFSRPYIQNIYESGLEIDTLLEKDAQIIAFSGGAMDVLYYCNRQGWEFFPGSTMEDNINNIERFRSGQGEIKRGRHYFYSNEIAGNKKYFVVIFNNMLMSKRVFKESGLEDYLNEHYALAHWNIHYLVYDLTKTLQFRAGMYFTDNFSQKNNNLIQVENAQKWEGENKSFYYSKSNAAKPAYLIYHFNPAIPAKRLLINVTGYVTEDGFLRAYISQDNKFYELLGRTLAFQEQKGIYLSRKISELILLLKYIWIGKDNKNIIHAADKSNRYGGILGRILSLNYFADRCIFMVDKPEGLSDIFIKIEFKGATDWTKIYGLEVRTLN